MSARDFFTTGLRLFGVWALLHTVDYWLQAFDISAGFFKPTHDSIGICASHIVVYFVIGLYLLMGAPHLVSFAFDRRPRERHRLADLPSDRDEDGKT